MSPKHADAPGEASGRHEPASVRLSAHELREVERATTLLLSSLAAPDPAAWQLAVLRSIKSLLRADKASMMVPPWLGFPSSACECISPDDVRDFPIRIQPLDRRWTVWKRQVELGVSDRDLLWGPMREDFVRSAYYNEFIVPGQLFDALIMNVQVGGAPGPDAVAGLWFHHDRPTGPRFGDRGLALLRLLLPSFRAGMLALKRVGSAREAFARTIDALGRPVALFAHDGRLLHESPALAAARQDEPQRHRLDAAMRAVVAEVARPIAVPTRTIGTERATYRIDAAHAPADLLPGPSCVLVTVGIQPVHATVASTCSAAEVAERHGLTTREAEIAVLLAAGASSQEVAERLRLSPHTVRRHTEHVYGKLGVHSRAELSAVVHGGVRHGATVSLYPPSDPTRRP